MFRILNVEPSGYDPDARKILESQFQLDVAALPRHELLREISNYDVLITRLGHQIDAEIFAAAPRLKAIATATTGLNHIDLEEAQRRKIAVLSLKGETAFLKTVTATAELTWGLLLSLIRRIPSAHASVCEETWNRDLFWGSELQGKTLGLIGLGRLGEIVAQYGLCFGMEVIAFDPYVTNTNKLIRQTGDVFELIERAEAISLHVPFSPETDKMFSRRHFERMSKDSVLINTSRGEIVDEEALLDALKNQHIGGAATDVIADERNFPSPVCAALIDYARTHDNLIFTPHIGGATKDSVSKTEVFMAKKITDFLSAIEA